MTTAELKTRLGTLLASQLGTYVDKTGAARGPAIHAGEPPDLTARGLEVIIDAIPEITTVNLHTSPALLTDRRVRLIPHDTRQADGRSDPTLPALVETATRRILTALTVTSVAHIPQSEPLGILAQTVITIRS